GRARRARLRFGQEVPGDAAGHGSAAADDQACADLLLQDAAVALVYDPPATLLARWASFRGFLFVAAANAVEHDPGHCGSQSSAADDCRADPVVMRFGGRCGGRWLSRLGSRIGELGGCFL